MNHYHESLALKMQTQTESTGVVFSGIFSSRNCHLTYDNTARNSTDIK